MQEKIFGKRQSSIIVVASSFKRLKYHRYPHISIRYNICVIHDSHVALNNVNDLIRD